VVAKLQTVKKLHTVTKLRTVTKLQTVTKRKATQEPNHANISGSVVTTPLTSKLDDEDWSVTLWRRFTPEERAADTPFRRCCYLLLGHVIGIVRNSRDEYGASGGQEIRTIFIEKHHVKRSLNVGVESLDILV
jgi:hypothetical protein